MLDLTRPLCRLTCQNQVLNPELFEISLEFAIFLKTMINIHMKCILKARAETQALDVMPDGVHSLRDIIHHDH